MAGHAPILSTHTEAAIFSNIMYYFCHAKIYSNFGQSVLILWVIDLF